MPIPSIRKIKLFIICIYKKSPGNESWKKYFINTGPGSVLICFLGRSSCILPPNSASSSAPHMMLYSKWLGGVQWRCILCCAGIVSSGSLGWWPFHDSGSFARKAVLMSHQAGTVVRGATPARCPVPGCPLWSWVPLAVAPSLGLVSSATPAAPVTWALAASVTLSPGSR